MTFCLLYLYILSWVLAGFLVLFSCWAGRLGGALSPFPPVADYQAGTSLSQLSPGPRCRMIASRLRYTCACSFAQPEISVLPSLQPSLSSRAPTRDHWNMRPTHLTSPAGNHPDTEPPSSSPGPWTIFLASWNPNSPLPE